MEEERGKRRRGRRRGRQEGHQRPKPGPEETPSGDLEVTEESSAPGIIPSVFRFRRRGRSDDEEQPPKERRSAEKAASSSGPGGSANVHPTDFWRRTTVRPYREQPLPRVGPARLWKRITGLYFPPWVPVVAIILVVFGILAGLFITRSATGAPRIGKDHWHATYQFIACGERQPNAPTWEGGVHTHGDGVIHIHPFTPAEEGAGARLVKWFDYGGGKLTGDSIKMPGSSKTYTNGDKCPDGTTGTLQIFVNNQKMNDWSRYIPHDGDRIRMVFGPIDTSTQESDRTVIPESQATRTIDLTVTDDGSESNSAFSPASIEVNAGETVKLVIKNVGQLSHGLRVRGDDGQYLTSDDYVSNPDVIKPGQTGTVVMRLDSPGQNEFRDEIVNATTGTIIIKQASGATPAPSATPSVGNVDVTLDVTAGESYFQPAQLTVKAGQKFLINLKNTGALVHTMRIAGPDGQFGTADDIVSTDVKPGATGQLVGQLDKPGTYAFQDEFNPTQMTGTITVQ